MDIKNIPHKKENMVLFYFLSFTWGILYTLIGLLVLGFIRIFLNNKIKHYKVVAGRIAIITNRSLPGAFELGICYIVDQYAEKNYYLHTHEIGHSIQNIIFGPFFIFLVIAGAIRFNMYDYLSNRYYKKHGKHLSYDDAWFEGQASKLGHIYCGERVNKFIEKIKKQ